MNFTSLLLSKIEEIPTLGLKAQLKMAPPQRFGTMKTLLAIPENVRYAAVMMLLYPIEGELHFCLIQRSNYAGKHSGQISFPGGKKSFSGRTGSSTQSIFSQIMPTDLRA